MIIYVDMSGGAFGSTHLVTGYSTSRRYSRRGKLKKICEYVAREDDLKSSM